MRSARAAILRRHATLIPFLSSGLYRRPRNLTGSAGTVTALSQPDVPARGLSPPVGIFTPPRNEQPNDSTNKRNNQDVCCSGGQYFLVFPGNMDMIWICRFGPAVGLSGSDTQIWSGGGFEWFGYAILDKLSDDWLNYPAGAFSRLFDFCIVPGFWINSMIFALSYTIFGSFSVSLGSVCSLIAG